MAKTLEEAIEGQATFLDVTDKELSTHWRAHSINDAYEYKPMHEYGIGFFSVHKETQEVCECKMQWYHDGQILMCPVCFLEGT